MKQTKIVQVQTHDNYSLDVKIDYPVNSESVIIFCHGSGANTYDNHREIAGKEFNYFDLFVDEFGKRNIAFAVGTREAAEYQMFLRILCL